VEREACLIRTRQRQAPYAGKSLQGQPRHLHDAGYEALAANESAVIAMGDDKLKVIATKAL
jgi:hypothetical protein